MFRPRALPGLRGLALYVLAVLVVSVKVRENWKGPLKRKLHD